MNLLDVRTKFIELSGRSDLVVDEDDYVDNGANFFINAGCRYLDRLDILPKTIAKLYKRVEEGDWYTTFNECRAVKQVYMANDEERWKLDHKELGWLMLEYDEPIADIDTDSPEYYSNAILRTIPQSLGSITMSQFVDEIVQLDVSHMAYNGIIWMPPCDETHILEVQGLFYSEELTRDTDVNHWTIRDPIILVYAALRSLEISYRNTEGANDWTRAIREEVATLGMDLVEEEIADVTEMEG